MSDSNRFVTPPDAVFVLGPDDPIPPKRLTGNAEETWSYGGTTFHAKTIGRWDPRQHPRDSHGRFVESDARVRLSGGATGTVTNFDSSSGKFVVHRDDNRIVRVLPSHLTVIDKPTGQRDQPPPPATPAQPQVGRDRPGDVRSQLAGMAIRRHQEPPLPVRRGEPYNIDGVQVEVTHVARVAGHVSIYGRDAQGIEYHAMVPERPPGSSQPAPPPLRTVARETVSPDQLNGGDMIEVEGREYEVVSKRRSFGGNWFVEARTPGEESGTQTFGFTGNEKATRIRRRASARP